MCKAPSSAPARIQALSGPFSASCPAREKQVAVVHNVVAFVLQRQQELLGVWQVEVEVFHEVHLVWRHPIFFRRLFLGGDGVAVVLFM